ncbi:GNAT family N-acetyltransferase [Erwinia sp. HDF1-3R]|uniref:GNAT family N-acetyltransferase n=1 Tax=Erwinia sp. HDF1-3R TaxID=3141543 RepID=UPI0031F50F1D
MSIEEKYFHNINLNCDFFNSLRADYEGFDEWFILKSESKAYVSYNEAGEMDGFLYLKIENEPINDTNPNFPAKQRLKLGIFKINAHGTKLGERFVRLVFQFAMNNSLKEIYVTIFDKHAGLITLLNRYGFELRARKIKPTINGHEGVYFKSLEWRD